MYNGYVTSLKNIRKHSNADRLMLAECFGNQVIVGLNANEEDLGIYFPTDGQLSEVYCIENDLVRRKDADGKEIGGYLDPNKRNIRTMRLRKEISDGLFMPLTSLSFAIDISKLKDGDLISIVNGVEICKKYVPVCTHKESTCQTKKEKRKSGFKTFTEHADTKQFAYSLSSFKPGDICYITLKMHGTSGRTGYHIKETSTPNGFLRRLFTKVNHKITKEWDYVTGTRRVVLKPNSDGGYYGTNSFRTKIHDRVKDKLMKGETIYYEIVGYSTPGSPIMGSISNSKIDDKEFIKKYGKDTVFSYGCSDGETDMYIYRMTMTNEDGFCVEYPLDYIKIRADQMGEKVVPELDRFIFTNIEDAISRMNTHVEGEDPIGKTHTREGCVIRVEGKDGFKAYKKKSIPFKILEGINKDSGEVDTEELEAMKSEE